MHGMHNYLAVDLGEKNPRRRVQVRRSKGSGVRSRWRSGWGILQTLERGPAPLAYLLDYVFPWLWASPFRLSTLPARFYFFAWGVHLPVPPVVCVCVCVCVCESPRASPCVYVCVCVCI